MNTGIRMGVLQCGVYADFIVLTWHYIVKLSIIINYLFLVCLNYDYYSRKWAIDCALNVDQSEVRISSTSKSSPIYEILLCLLRHDSLDMRLSKFPRYILIKNKLVSHTQRNSFPRTIERSWNALYNWLEDLWGFCLLSNSVNEIPSKVQATKRDAMPPRAAALQKWRLNTKNYKLFKRTINTIVYIFGFFLFAVHRFPERYRAIATKLSSTTRRDRSSADT